MEFELHKPIYQPIRMREIKVQGWFLNQLKIQAAGLSGNLDKFWPDIKDSKWIGGITEGWERVPYWLDGFIPLAWLINDEDMKARAQKYIDYIIEHQSADGWICPDDNADHKNYDMWALFLILKVLIVYHDATDDARIEDVVRKALLALDSHIDQYTLFNWAHTRWFECLISIWWLYERAPEKWLVNLASKLHAQGFDWKSFFKRWPYKEPDTKGRWSQMSHAVNNAMALKAGVLRWRMTGEEEDLNCAEDMVKLLDEFHGMVTGVFTGDECLNGTSPVQGTELCAVAEYMYSLEHLIAVTGQSHWGDRLERIAFNALPATFSPDMWTHQYDQQVNQIQCSRQDNSIFGTNNGEAHLFGLEPNFGCCTANLSQPWPKLALSTFMRSPDGLSVVVYAPSSVNICIHGIKVSVILETEYPFRDSLTFKVWSEKEVEFTLHLRIPEWTENAVLILESGPIPVISGEFYNHRQKWSGETKLTLKLPMKVQLESRPNNLYALTCGPLVYSLPIGERWIRINKDMPGREYPHCDYEIYPINSWNYSLCLDKLNPEKGIGVEYCPLSNYPFSPDGAPVAILVNGRKVEWAIKNNSSVPFPDMKWISDEVEKLRLIPYGCTNLRMTEMPVLPLSKVVKNAKVYGKNAKG